MQVVATLEFELIARYTWTTTARLTLEALREAAA